MFETSSPKVGSRGAIPRTVWTLGFVSLFMDLSSEFIHSLLPILLVTTLGASVLTVGIIEGLAESIALVIKVFSGFLSDYVGRRKDLILLGYGIAALTKPLFPLAGSVETVLTARLLDRIGKGIRGAPRDALLADVAPETIRGACFGLRQSMDTAGAFLGPLLAVWFLYVFLNDLTTVLWFAVIPAVLAVLLILVGIEEPSAQHNPPRLRSPIHLRVLKNFSKGYWWIVVIGAMFTLARFSEAFLVLRALESGFSLTWAPSIMVVMCLTYTLSAFPAGVLSDGISKRFVLRLGLIFLIIADLALARADSVLIILLGAVLWGLHMGFTQGILSAMIADATPPDLKGTAFGMFNLVSGVCMLLASVLAGWLWEFSGPEVTFYAGGSFSLLALIMLGVTRP